MLDRAIVINAVKRLFQAPAFATITAEPSCGLPGNKIGCPVALNGVPLETLVSRRYRPRRTLAIHSRWRAVNILQPGDIMTDKIHQIPDPPPEIPRGKHRVPRH